MNWNLKHIFLQHIKLDFFGGVTKRCAVSTEHENRALSVIFSRGEDGPLSSIFKTFWLVAFYWTLAQNLWTICHCAPAPPPRSRSCKYEIENCNENSVIITMKKDGNAGSWAVTISAMDMLHASLGFVETAVMVTSHLWMLSSPFHFHTMKK